MTGADVLLSEGSDSYLGCQQGQEQPRDPATRVDRTVIARPHDQRPQHADLGHRSVLPHPPDSTPREGSRSARQNWAMLSHDDVRAIALSLPGAYEQASFGGRPSFRTKPRMFCWIREDPEAVLVFVESLEEKEVLLASDPDVFFTTPHYDGYAAVLVRLDTAEAGEARELITDSWRLRAPKRFVKDFDTMHPRPITGAEDPRRSPLQ